MSGVSEARAQRGWRGITPLTPSLSLATHPLQPCTPLSFALSLWGHKGWWSVSLCATGVAPLPLERLHHTLVAPIAVRKVRWSMSRL